MDFEKRLATAILDAIKIFKDSFDRKAADKAAQSTNLFNCADSFTFYKKSHKEAANEAADNVGFDSGMTLPICLLIKYTQNNIQAWAEEITKS